MKHTEINLFTEFPDVLEIKDLRKALGIGRAGAYKLLQSGEIDSFKIGNTYKIPKAALIAYITRQCGTEAGAKE